MNVFDKSLSFILDGEDDDGGTAAAVKDIAASIENNAMVMELDS
jgi:hypothetical protein